MTKAKSGKKIGILFAVLAMICCAVAAAVLSACDDTPTAQSGDEAGVYYYDDADRDREYLITLGEGLRYTLVADDTLESGTYTLNGETLTLSSGADGVRTAVFTNDTITLTYNNAQLTFLKKLYYTVTFDTLGGSDVAAASVLNGKTAQKPADPTLAGHAFLGWYADAEYTAPYLFDTPVSANATVYARWAAVQPGRTEYTVSYDTGYADEAIAPQQTIGGKLYAPATPAAREGMRFVGWWVSMENDPERLSFRFEAPTDDTDGTVFDADTTLFAVWQETDAEFASPAVSVSQQAVRWESVGASAYLVSIDAPDGTPICTDQRTTSTTFAVALTETGTYRVEVTAVNAGGAAVAEPTVRYYVNNALARVSGIEVKEPNALVFRGVEHAQKYLITIDCGNPDHRHEAYDNGTSLYYNFSNCDMQPGGIRFIIQAVAEGYAPSSSVFVFERCLAPVEDLTAADDAITWKSVPGATEYVVQIGNATYSTFDTSFSLSAFAAAVYDISVTPAAKGFNSPEAAQISYRKDTPALPDELCLTGTTLSWNGAEGIVYSLVIDGSETPIDAGKNSYDLSQLFAWTDGAEYSLQIKATANGASALSEPFPFRYNALDPVVTYEGGVISWKAVAGAQRYEIRLNGDDADIISVENGLTRYALNSLTRAGENIIEVRFINEGYISEWAKTAVYAHAVTFDSRGGSAVQTMYKAVGDRVELPAPTAKDGYDFVAWYNTPNGPETCGALYNDAFFVSSGEIVLYAYYSPKSYTVQYSGADELTTGTVYYGKDYTLDVPQSSDPTRAFGGWYSAPYGAGVAYTDAYGNSLAPWDIAEDGVTLYAFWVDAVLQYTAIGDGYAVSAGDRINLVTSVTIPAEYNGQKVTQIAGSAFANCTALEEINLPDTIESIATATAFSGCTSLRAVNVYGAGASRPRYASQDGVLFDGGDADAPHALRPVHMPAAKTGSYRIPDGVDIIPRAAFAGSMIDKIVIPASVVTIEAEAFADCTQLSSVVFENAGAIAPGLTIGERAFANCEALTAVTLPARLQEISLQKYALRSMNFTSADDVTEDAPDAFAGCDALTDITVAANPAAVYTSHEGALLTNGGRTLVYFPAGRSVTGYALPATVSEIADGAFLGCTIGGSLEITARITRIGAFAFAGTEIGSLTFSGGALTDLTVEEYAFYDCNDLTELAFEEGSRVSELGEGAFKDCGYLAEITIPGSMTFVGDEAFANCGMDDGWSISVTIEGGSNALELGNGVFSGCTIYTLRIPANVVLSPDFMNGLDVETILPAEGHPTLQADDNALYILDDEGNKETLLRYQSYDSEFAVPDGVKAIAANAFYGSYSIDSVTIPDSVTAIGERAFYNTGLGSVTFTGTGSAPLTIGDYAFYSTELTALVLPDRPVAIGAYAFAEIVDYYDDPCTTTIDLGGTTTVGDYAFYRTGSGVALTVPATVTSIGDHAFEGSGDSFPTNYISSVSFESGSALKTIGAYAFSRSYLSSFCVPASVESIGAYAFYYCTRLTSLTFEEGDAPLSFGTQYEEEDGGTKVGYVIAKSGITQLHFPGRLTTLCDYALYNDGYSDSDYEQLSEVTFGDQYAEGNFTASRLTTIGANAFRYTTSLTGIVIPASVRNTDVIAIGNEAFYGSAISSVVFAETDSDEGTLTIGENAFVYCNNLTQLTLPRRLGDFVAGSTYIAALANGTGVFPTLSGNEEDGWHGLASIAVTEGNALYASADGMLYTHDFGELVYCPPAKEDTVTVDARAKRVGENAFNGCRLLTEVQFADGSACVAIGANAFSGCRALTAIALPDGVSAIGNDAFLNCTALTALQLPASLASFDISMLGCENLQDLTVSEQNDLFTSIDGVLFSKDGATLLYYLPTRSDASYAIPEGTTEIAAQAFAGNGYLTSVTIPASVSYINTNAFNNCTQLSTVTFPAGDGAPLVIGDAAFGNTAVDTIALPARTSAVGDEAFADAALTEITFGNNGLLTSLGNDAFRGTDLVSIVLPAGLRTIGDNLFMSCTSLQSVVLPEGLTTMGSGTFYGCSSLVSAELPSTLRTIGAQTFYNCDRLTDVYFAANAQLETLPADTFVGCDSLEGIELPASLTAITGADPENSSSRGLFEGLTNLKSVTFAEGSRCLTIGDSAFEGSGLESFTIPSSVTTIGPSAFAYTALKEIEIPRTVTQLGGYAFSNCAQLTSVRLGTGINAIPDSVFQNCSLLGSIQIPASVTSISQSAFTGCSSLNSIQLDAANRAFSLNNGVLYNAEETEVVLMPATLTQFTIPAAMTSSSILSLLAGNLSLVSIGVEDGNPAYRAAHGALYDMQWNLLLVPAAMTEFTIPKEVTALAVQDENGESLFSGKAIRTIGFETGRVQRLTLQSGMMGYGVFVGLAELESVTLPDNTSIGAYAFYHCANLTSLTLGANGGTIGSRAFDGTGLTTLTLPEGFTEIGENAFYNCGALVEISLPASLATIAASAFNGCGGIEEIALAEGNTAFALDNGVLFNAEKTEILMMAVTVTSFTVPATLVSDSFLDILSGNLQLTEITVEEGNPAYRAAHNVLYDSEWNLVFVPSSATVLTLAKEVSDLDPYTLDNYALTEVHVEEGSTAYRSSFGAVYDTAWNLLYIPNAMTTYTIPKEVTSLKADGSFDGKAVQKVTYEEGGDSPLTLTSTYDSVFEGANGLTEVELPGRSVIGDYVFNNFSSLTGVTLAEGITSIGNYAFNNCSALTNLTLPSTLESIGQRAFYMCDRLAEITIPASVTTVGYDAFAYWGSYSTQHIYVPFAEGQLPEGWDAQWARGCSAGTIVYRQA